MIRFVNSNQAMSNMSADANKMLTTRQTAEYLSVSENTLRTWRWDGKGPRYIKVGAAVRYRQSDLERFIRDNTKTTSESV